MSALGIVTRLGSSPSKWGNMIERLGYVVGSTSNILAALSVVLSLILCVYETKTNTKIEIFVLFLVIATIIFSDWPRCTLCSYETWG